MLETWGRTVKRDWAVGNAVSSRAKVAVEGGEQRAGGHDMKCLAHDADGDAGPDVVEDSGKLVSDNRNSGARVVEERKWLTAAFHVADADERAAVLTSR